MSTLLITHPACLDHLTPLGHPERPDRLRAIERALEAEKFQTLARVQAPIAPIEAIALCHPMDYITAVREAGPKEGLIHQPAHGTTAGAVSKHDAIVGESSGCHATPLSLSRVTQRGQASPMASSTTLSTKCSRIKLPTRL